MDQEDSSQKSTYNLLRKPWIDFWLFSPQEKSIFNHMKSVLVKRNQFLWQEINFYDKKIDSCDKKSILVIRTQILSQEIISCELTSFN